MDSLRTQGTLIANVLASVSTEGVPEPFLVVDSNEPLNARDVLKTLYVPVGMRARLFDKDGNLIADSYNLADEVVVTPLPPAVPADEIREHVAEARAGALLKAPFADAQPAGAPTSLAEEVAQAMLGEVVTSLRAGDGEEPVVSVSIPIQHVQAVLGVLTLEAGDMSEIIAAERRALVPFVLFALAVTLASSLLLTLFIARPVRRLAMAADQVRQEGPRRAAIPDMSRRGDEIGDLSASLSAMTRGLADRIDAIEHFAADVAHELKNPLTSIRSAIETLPNTSDEDRRRRLLGVLQHDVQRIDRLITDISNASRIDADLARSPSMPVDLRQLLTQMAESYSAIRKDDEAAVAFDDSDANGMAISVSGLETQLSQVFRNLIDNARTFSPDGGTVHVRLETLRYRRAPDCAIVLVEDDGPGLPADNVERVFERFYTDRPKGAAFGSHSGLGLAIARQIVESHGGRIWAENREAGGGAVVGARFVVELPLRS